MASVHGTAATVAAQRAEHMFHMLLAFESATGLCSSCSWRSSNPEVCDQRQCSAKHVKCKDLVGDVPRVMLFCEHDILLVVVDPLCENLIYHRAVFMHAL